MSGKCGSNGEHVEMCYQGGEVMKYSAPPVVIVLTAFKCRVSIRMTDCCTKKSLQIPSDLQCHQLPLMEMQDASSPCVVSSRVHLNAVNTITTGGALYSVPPHPDSAYPHAPHLEPLPRVQ